MTSWNPQAMIVRDRLREFYYRVLPDRRYLRAYANDTDRRVSRDAEEGIGGRWQEIGQLQFDYLVDKGLRPHHRMLDLGCGTLRGGLRFIDYLDAASYTGIDISEQALEIAGRYVETAGLESKAPRLLKSEDGSLRACLTTSERFDFILAQSVFTHLRKSQIAGLMAEMAGYAETGGQVYFTAFLGEEGLRGYKTFVYPPSFFEQAGREAGLELKFMDDYRHPRGQRIVRATRAR